MSMSTPDKKTLNECLEYNQTTGELLWKTRPRSHFDSHHGFISFNGKHVGKLAGSVRIHQGTGKSYRYIMINLKHYPAHRIIWKMLYDEDALVDHVNGNGLNNILENLRSVSRQENARNQRKRCDNSTGVTGVISRGNSYRARINHNGVRESREFRTLSAAKVWRMTKEKQYGYHQNHGTERPL